uniref:Uncharacterized protein n=1 Tax=mine drainage metagenome TaxID=410659 RepID=E6QNZ2_9ZZZZ
MRVVYGVWGDFGNHGPAGAQPRLRTTKGAQPIPWDLGCRITELPIVTSPKIAGTKRNGVTAVTRVQQRKSDNDVF